VPFPLGVCSKSSHDFLEERAPNRDTWDFEIFTITWVADVFSHLVLFLFFSLESEERLDVKGG
jgi:hypothetical protein